MYGDIYQGVICVVRVRTNEFLLLKSGMKVMRCAVVHGNFNANGAVIMMKIFFLFSVQRKRTSNVYFAQKHSNTSAV